jgi:hypothetical protein
VCILQVVVVVQHTMQFRAAQEAQEVVVQAVQELLAWQAQPIPAAAAVGRVVLD